MKILSLPFRTRLSLFPIKNFDFFAMQLLIFFLRLSTDRPLRFGQPFRYPRRTLLAELWWAQMDSDHRPHAYQACALTS